jgi:hypothetical protein
LEVGEDYSYYKEVTPIIKEFDSAQDDLYLFAKTGSHFNAVELTFDPWQGEA